ncbi:MAG: sigma factor-like helix-turn-helix DNA-binding protein [Planctomycetota bacterium]
MSGTEATRVRDCLGSLDQTDRYVVLMFFADELTPTEISMVLDISVGRVNDTLKSFRDTIARILSPRQPQRSAQSFVADWLVSSGSAVV